MGSNLTYRLMGILPLGLVISGCQPEFQPVSAPAHPQLAQEQRPAEPSQEVAAAVVPPVLPAPAKAETPEFPWNPVSGAEPFVDRPSPTLREWTSSSGEFHTAAKFTGLVEGQVQLSKAAGGQVLVPLEKLSVNDRKYVKELIRVDPTANVIIGKVSRVQDMTTIVVVDDEKNHVVLLDG